jgi:hypothetical protein
MSTKKYLELRVTRDFGEKISAVVQFIQQNFVAIAKNLLVIGSPLVVLGLVLYMLLGQRMGDVWDTGNAGVSAAEKSIAFMTVFGVSAVYFMVIINTVLAISYSMIALYLENPADIRDIRKVFDMTKRIFWKIAAVSLILFFVFMVLYVLFIILFGGIAATIGMRDSASIILVVLLFIIGMVVFMYILFAFSFSHLAVVIEGEGIFSSLIRSLQLVQGNWWSTFAFLFVINIMITVLFYAFLLPSWLFSAFINIVSLDKAENYSVIFAVFSAFGLLGSELVFVIYCIALAVQYFHLVELKENTGLHNKIFSIGINKGEPEEEW